jgi:elongation factor G
MPTFQPKDIRNIILLGHSGSGKTSLAEAILFSAGAISKMGTVPEGNTVSDYNEDEKDRKCSLSSSLMSLVSGSTKINIIDTPGYTDFVGEAIGGLRAADSSLIVVNGTGSVEFGTERGFKMSKEKGAACVFFINRLDK